MSDPDKVEESAPSGEGDTAATQSSLAKKNGCLMGCLVMAVAALVLGGGMFGWRTYKANKAAQALAAQKAKELEGFDEVIEKLAAVPEEPEYDIDQTIRVMHSIDMGLESHTDFESFLAMVQSADTRGVAPEVLEARSEVFKVLRDLYASQEDLEAKKSLWRYTRGFFLTTMGIFSVNLSPVDFEFGVDKEQAQESLADLKAEYAEIESLESSIHERENELFNAMYGYADKYYTYLAEWDRLCARRDRAYLAATEGNWPAVVDASREAIALAPDETEAHLLLAMALVEQGDEMAVPEARALLKDYVEEHPERSAPAYLLRGVLEARQGNMEEATLQLGQAAAYYPKQAAALTDMLDPYKQQAFLRKSREGNYILHQYKSMMLGAGYHSPDLQTARIYYDQGDREAGDRKVFDHFYRRRLQKQWDFILSDIDYCYEFLGTPFQQIYPESSYLDLMVKPSTFSSKKLKVSVKNRSDRILHNASLILCLHMTDMITGDYQAIQAGETQPAVLAMDSTDFGEVEIDLDVHGMNKTVGDIVAVRAILVAQEAVVWVDTETYRIAEAREFREQRKKGEPVPSLDIDWVQRMQQDPKALLGDVLNDVEIRKVENRWGKDSVEVKLPKELAILRPMFRLMVNGKGLSPEKNQITEDNITLTFDKVAEFADEDIQQLELILNSPFTDVLMKWLAARNKDTYELKEVEGK